MSRLVSVLPTAGTESNNDLSLLCTKKLMVSVWFVWLHGQWRALDEARKCASKSAVDKTCEKSEKVKEKQLQPGIWPKHDPQTPLSLSSPITSFFYLFSSCIVVRRSEIKIKPGRRVHTLGLNPRLFARMVRKRRRIRMIMSGDHQPFGVILLVRVLHGPAHLVHGMIIYKLLIPRPSWRGLVYGAVGGCLIKSFCLWWDFSQGRAMDFPGRQTIIHSNTKKCNLFLRKPEPA